MMWTKPVLATAVAALASAVAATSAAALRVDGCPTGTFPVSVLEDPEIHCLSGRPCSGTYSAAGIPQGVGACPSNTGCALLPGNEAIMGCVPAGRGDVAYVNADGSLTRGGKVVSGPAGSSSSPPAATTKAGAADTTNTADPKKSVTTTTNNNNSDDNNNSSGSKAPSSASATVKPGNTDGSSGKPADSPASVIGSQGAGASNTTTEAPTAPTQAPTATPTATPVATLKATSAPPDPTTATVTSQQTLADIDGETKTNQGDTNSTGVGITSIIGIVVGCLAVVAVVAGVRLLKKDKEAVVDTPEGGMLDDYGGGITPKENVVLL